MCGRYTLTAGQRSALEQRFGASLPDGGLERFNVAPTESVLAVTEGRKGRLLRWGLVPFWAKDLKAGARMINCRSETAGSKPPFAELIDGSRGRCLVLADGFYEWLRPEDKRQPRVPFHFTVDGGTPFAFAGLWTVARIDGEKVATATILTTTPNSVVARLHDRMPVILPDPDAEAAWLSDDLKAAEALELCRPIAAERMRAAPANPLVNKPDPDGEGPHLLVAPDEPPQTPATLF